MSFLRKAWFRTPALTFLAVLFFAPSVLADQVSGNGSAGLLKALWTETELAAPWRESVPETPNPKIDPAADQLLPKSLPDSLAHLLPGKKLSIRRVDPDDNKKLIALTFDLCQATKKPSGYDHRVVNILRREGVPATFFAGGRWMEDHPVKTLQLLADPLFEIGSHSWSHPRFESLPTALIKDEVLRTQRFHAALWTRLAERAQKAGLPGEMRNIPRIPGLFRFPYGSCSTPALELLAAMNLAAIQWDLVTGDPDPLITAREIAEKVLREARPGSIVIAHANGRGRQTAEALESIIPALRERGYGFVTVGELLRSGRPIGVGECYESRPGDNRPKSEP